VRSMKKILKHWQNYQRAKLATLALQAQVTEYRAAFFAGARAATIELMELTPAEQRGQVEAEILAEIAEARA
jgi:hypothetical protein